MKSWLIWCDLNYEQDALEALFGDDCVSVRGSTPPELKMQYEERWRTGQVPILITKPSVFGYGMNWQHCNNVIFFGLSNSYEMYYQAIRRTWRYGQVNDVDVFVVVSAADGSVVANIRRKELQAAEMFDNLVQHMAVHTDLGSAVRQDMEYKPEKKVKIPAWVKQNNKTPTVPGNTWIDLDSITHKWDTAPEFRCGVLVGDQPIVTPNWIQSVV